MHTKKTKIRMSRGDRILSAVTTIFLVFIFLIIAYPLIVIISSSFSSSKALSAGKVVLFPVDFTISGYKFVFQYKDVWRGFRNSIFYTIAGVTVTMTLQILMAYPLSRPDYQGKPVILKIMLVAMMFSAGLIPSYILKMKLGMVDSVTAIIFAGAISINNVFMLRNAFRHSIPGELFDAAIVDGASDFTCLLRIAIPLAKATISVLMLYSFVGCWNDYFNAMIYLPTKRELWPLQLVLRNILSSAGSISTEGMTTAAIQQMQDSGIAQIKYCLIIIATVPVLGMYLVVQKYFEKGVLVGSVKG